MANPTLSLPKKNTANTNAQATPEASTIAPNTDSSNKSSVAVPVATVEQSDHAKVESIKTVSTPIKSEAAADNASTENNAGKNVDGKASQESVEVIAERTKMDVATEIYLQMKKTKGITRKEILERFVSEAKLSKAGASTYFQLIKAKHP